MKVGWGRKPNLKGGGLELESEGNFDPIWISLQIWVDRSHRVYLCHREPSRVGEFASSSGTGILVDDVELFERLPGRGFEAVDSPFAVPDGRRRLMSTSYSVLVQRTQRSRSTHRLYTRHLTRDLIISAKEVMFLPDFVCLSVCICTR